MDELDEWKHAINFYLEELEELKKDVHEILEFNTVTDLAAKAEHHLNELDLSRLNFLHQQENIELMEAQLSKQQPSAENGTVSDDIKKQQKELRNNMHGLEKEYLDTRFTSRDFVVDTIDKQLKKRKNHP